MGGIGYLGTGTQTVEDLAEEPFARVSAAAFRQVLWPEFARRLGNLACLGYTGVILPQPCHGGWILCKPLVERQRPPVLIHGQRSAPGGVYSNSYDLARLEAFDGFAGLRQGPFDRGFGPGDIISRMLSRQVWVTRKKHALSSVGIIPNRRCDLSTIGNINDDCSDGVCPVVQTNSVS